MHFSYNLEAGILNSYVPAKGDVDTDKTPFVRMAMLTLTTYVGHVNIQNKIKHYSKRSQSWIFTCLPGDSFPADRFIAICYPLKYQNCTVGQIRGCLVGIILLSILSSINAAFHVRLCPTTPNVVTQYYWYR